MKKANLSGVAPKDAVTLFPRVVVNLCESNATFASKLPITVAFEMPTPTQTDWIAVAEAGSPDNSIVYWAYTGGLEAGVVPVRAPETGGKYELRLYREWPTGKYEVHARQDIEVT